MKNGIQDEKYYFLLDWKDNNMEEYISIKGSRRLCDLTPYELNKLYEALSEQTTKADTSKANLNIGDVMRMLWRGIWGKFMTIAFLTLIAQLIVRYLDENWELHKIWHVIGWATWFIICLVFKIVRRKNYA